MLNYSQDEAQRIYAWARYVFWADVECRQYEAHERLENEPTVGQSMVLMLQFYAALWVVAEGWRECPLSDETVDELLNDPAFEANVRLLRRLRNSVYHYQSDLICQRLLAFLREGEYTVTWAFLLHDEFKRVLWEVAHPPHVNLELQSQLAEGIRSIVGWLPCDIPEAAPNGAAVRYREIAEMVLTNGTRNTDHGRGLVDAANQFRSAAHQAAAGWTQQKRAMIDALKRQHQIVHEGAS